MKAIIKKNQYGRLVNDGWEGKINGEVRQFTVIGVSGNHPVIQFNDTGIRAILDWDKGIII